MVSALKAHFVTVLRAHGFKGSFPHFRRAHDKRIDLLTVQFDRHGGGFVIEISRCGPEGFTTPWGKHIPPAKVTAHDINPRDRPRLESNAPGAGGSWFRYDDGTPPDNVALRAAECLDDASRWWGSG
jgi:hypothetical protein